MNVNNLKMDTSRSEDGRLLVLFEASGLWAVSSRWKQVARKVEGGSRCAKLWMRAGVPAPDALSSSSQLACGWRLVVGALSGSICNQLPQSIGKILI